MFDWQLTSLTWDLLISSRTSAQGGQMSGSAACQPKGQFSRRMLVIVAFTAGLQSTLSPCLTMSVLIGNVCPRSTTSKSSSSHPTALLYKPIDRVTRSTLVLHVSTQFALKENKSLNNCIFFQMSLLRLQWLWDRDPDAWANQSQTIHYYLLRCHLSIVLSCRK